MLVNNAGMGDLLPIEETTLADWERTIAIDQTGVFLGMKIAAPLLKASGPSCPLSARRRELARPRVRCCSSRVTR